MKFIKGLFIFIVIIAAIILIGALFMPAKFQYETKININAPAEMVFEQVDNVKNWENWSPWSEQDTTMVITYGEIVQGTGSSFSWTSENMGSGELTIAESIQLESIKTKLNLGGQAADGYWKFEFADNVTTITWGIEYDQSYPIGRWFTLFYKAAMEKSFNKGLENMKAFIESMSVEPKIEITEKTIGPLNALLITDSSTMENMSQTMGTVYGELMAYLEEKQIEISGVPFTIYLSWDPEGYTTFQAGVSVAEEMEGKDRIEFKAFPEASVISAIHYGPYNLMEPVYNALDAYMAENNKIQAGGPWEFYVTDPQKEEDSTKWVTEICFPIMVQ